MSTSEVPEELKCLITHELLEDAVVDKEGNSYSEWAIKEWLARNGTSPVTRKPMRLEDLVPNRLVRDLVDNYRATYKVEKRSGSRPGSGATTATTKTQQNPPSRPTLELQTTRSGNKLLVSVVPPSSISRLPTHIVAVIDTSGSMCSAASVTNEQGHRESYGLTQLDLVQHSINTIIQCLEVGDKLSLVSYSSTATVVFEGIEMNDAGKKKAKAKLDALSAGGQTNLWDGLLKGMETVRNHKQTGIYNENIMLFTDGMPNVVPPRGHLPMLKRYIDEHGLVASINTFGFGYSLDSKLLHELAVEGMGAYGFIPDSSLVGTVFVNAISNQMAKCFRNVVLNIEETSDCKLSTKIPVQGGYEYTKTTWGVQVRLGDVIYGQPKDVILCFDDELDKYEQPDKSCVSGVDLTTGKTESGTASEEVHDTKRLEVHNMRTLFVDTVRHAIKLGIAGSLSEARSGMDKLQHIMFEGGLITDQVKDLHADIIGQVSEALQDRYFTKWGRHFLPSLMTAHLHQQCNNFKDPGVQHYGGGLFGALRDKADEVFVKLPPPTPKQGRGGYTSGGYQHKPGKPVQMKNYYNKSGGCVAGEGLALTPDGMKQVNTLKRGDVVCTVQGDAEIICVVRMAPKGGKIDMVTFEGGLKVTPFHPVLNDSGDWVFPSTVHPATLHKATHVYDFVLSNGHTICVNGVTCVTLGHGFTSPVVAHHYFGTNRVIADLENHPEFTTGEVTLTSESFIRDPSGHVTGLVC